MMRRSIDLTQQAEIYITASPGSPGEKPTRERPSSRVSCRFVPLLAAKVRSLGDSSFRAVITTMRSTARGRGDKGTAPLRRRRRDRRPELPPLADTKGGPGFPGPPG